MRARAQKEKGAFRLKDPVFCPARYSDRPGRRACALALTSSCDPRRLVAASSFFPPVAPRSATTSPDTRAVPVSIRAHRTRISGALGPPASPRSRLALSSSSSSHPRQGTPGSSSLRHATWKLVQPRSLPPPALHWLSSAAVTTKRSGNPIDPILMLASASLSVPWRRSPLQRRDRAVTCAPEPRTTRRIRRPVTPFSREVAVTLLRLAVFQRRGRPLYRAAMCEMSQHSMRWARPRDVTALTR